jgi:glycosyltransferase involved in cell wall biosynthesis
MSTVSVVIPTYNGSTFVVDSLNSVFQQTRRPDEIIVVDDCSTDETASLIGSLAKESPVPVRFMSLAKNSGGPSRPLNVGIEAAMGEVILTLDQDDRMRPRRVELQLRTLKSCPQCSIAIGQLSIMGQDEGDLSLLWSFPQFEGLAHDIDRAAEFSVIESKKAFRALLIRNYAASSSNFGFTKKWWNTIGGFNEKIMICNDLDYMLRATLAAPIAIINEILFDYRWCGSSLQRRDVTHSTLEATMVRLRAASAKPEWAGEELEVLRYSALMLGGVSLRKRDIRGVRAIAEIFARHKGLQTLRQTLNNKARRLLEFG